MELNPTPSGRVKHTPTPHHAKLLPSNHRVRPSLKVSSPRAEEHKGAKWGSVETLRSTSQQGVPQGPQLKRLQDPRKRQCGSLSSPDPGSEEKTIPGVIFLSLELTSAANKQTPDMAPSASKLEKWRHMC